MTRAVAKERLRALAVLEAEGTPLVSTATCLRLGPPIRVLFYRHWVVHFPLRRSGFSLLRSGRCHRIVPSNKWITFGLNTKSCRSMSGRRLPTRNSWKRLAKHGLARPSLLAALSQALTCASRGWRWTIASTVTTGHARRQAPLRKRRLTPKAGGTARAMEDTTLINAGGGRDFWSAAATPPITDSAIISELCCKLM